MARDRMAELMAAAGLAPYGASGMSAFGSEPTLEEIMAAGMSAFGMDASSAFGAAAPARQPSQAMVNQLAMMQKRAQVHANQTPLNNAPANSYLGQMPLAINSGSKNGLPFIVPAGATQPIQGTPNVDFQPYRYVTGVFATGAGFLVTQPTMGINGAFASGDPVDASTLTALGQGLEIKFPLVKANTPINASINNYSAVNSPFVSSMYGHMQQ